MKVNYEFYQNKNDKITKEEDLILKFSEKFNKDIEQLENEATLDEILALSKIRENILSWYPFKEDSRILEVGANIGELTGLLCEKAKEVVAVEDNKTKAEMIAKRHQIKNNLEVIAGRIQDIKFEKKFNYIILIGFFERKDVYFKETIDILMNYLTDDGIILLAMDNKLGIKYFSKTDKTGITVANPVDTQFINIDDICDYFQKIGFEGINIYYPMPDWKLTNAVFTDLRPISKSDLSRNVLYNSEDTIIFYDENVVYRELLNSKNKIAKNFANSFLIEISKQKQNNDIKFVSFANMRKPEYRIKTIMKEGYVYKYPASKESVRHIEETKENIDIIKSAGLKTLDSYNEKGIISEFSPEKTLDEIIIELFKNDKRDEAINLMKNFQNEIKEKLQEGSIENNVFERYNIKVEKEELNKMYFLKNGLWDLIFQNCFYINQEFYFYDQEWKEENLPIDFIIYRAIKYFTRLKKYISDEELYDILEINSSMIKIFDELDDKIQEKIRNPIMWKLNTQGKSVMDLKRDTLTLNHQINLLNIEKNQKEQEIAQKDEQIIQKEQEIQNLRNQLNLVFNSTSWKITKPLRKLKGLTKE